MLNNWLVQCIWVCMKFRLELELTVVAWFIVHIWQLVGEKHYASSEIQTRLSSVAEENSRLMDAWQKRWELFSQSHTFQLFLRSAEQRDTWISTQAYPMKTYIGNNISSYISLSSLHCTFSTYVFRLHNSN